MRQRPSSALSDWLMSDGQNLKYMIHCLPCLLYKLNKDAALDIGYPALSDDCLLNLTRHVIRKANMQGIKTSEQKQSGAGFQRRASV